jgi:thiamine biosynthesis lipoprotein
MSAGRAAAGDASPPPHAPEFEIVPRDGGIVAVCFVAMASPCELLLQTADAEVAREVGRVGAQEAWRVETKFSRYRPESIVSVINRSQGHAVVVDGETAALLDYAAQCHALSRGRFDITSGVLRRCWTFDGSDRLPEPAAVAALLPLIGFEKIRWQSPRITLPAGMEIDFGGIGKEYAVDRVLTLVVARFAGAALVNFGGDLAANRAPVAGPWRVGVERPDTEREARLLLELSRGGLATSGDTHRFLLRNGVRYGHILDPRSGWPVSGTPRSVTVAAASCVEAGMLATFAVLQGSGAEAFLEEQGVRFWCLR